MQDFIVSLLTAIAKLLLGLLIGWAIVQLIEYHKKGK